jgi:hypothetical protein
MNDWEKRSEWYLWGMGRVKLALSVLESAAWWSLCSSGLSFRPLMVRRATFDRVSAGLYDRMDFQCPISIDAWFQSYIFDVNTLVTIDWEQLELAVDSSTVPGAINHVVHM